MPQEAVPMLHFHRPGMPALKADTRWFQLLQGGHRDIVSTIRYAGNNK
jgi:hypothetical protein